MENTTDLHEFFTIGASIFTKINGQLDDRAQETCSELFGSCLSGDGCHSGLGGETLSQSQPYLLGLVRWTDHVEVFFFERNRG